MVLTLVKLTDAEYVLSAVASGLEDYYMGVGEAPGVWHGRWANRLGLEGVVEADDLRALVDGRHPSTGADLVVGTRQRRVKAFDVTLSAPKSVSILWAFGPPDVGAIASQAHSEAASLALDFLESKTAVGRRQVDGVRTQVGTSGLAVATFMHRVSREGDPQLHSHNVVANLVRRTDGTHCALDAAPLHHWAKAAGCVYQEQLRRLLTQRLGVEWGPDRHGTREMVGLAPDTLRVFSKRSAQIEAFLQTSGQTYQSPAAAMQADDFASVATRPAKDPGFTPELLRQRWAGEAAAAGIGSPRQVRDLLCGRQVALEALRAEEIFARLIDPEVGLCAHDSRFGEAHVVEAIAGVGSGRFDVARIQRLTRKFLGSEHVLRLMDTEPDPTRRRPPQWSTVAHRALEDRVLGHLDTLATTEAQPLDPDGVEAAIAGEHSLGADQAQAVRQLCGPGPALRSLISPAGFGKTTAVHAGAVAATAQGRPVLGVATTNKAVAELVGAGIASVTIARLGIEMAHRRCLAPDTVVILDEASQTCTADAEVVLGAVTATPGCQLWALGDVRQAQAVRAGGLAAQIDRLGGEGVIPAPALTENRRQIDPLERAALARYRAGQVAASQAIRAGAGWEHHGDTPAATRSALAAAAVADADSHGANAVAVLAVSHADCEDLADRIRAIRTARAELGGPSIAGPGWGTEPRHYATGDRVLLHARLGRGHRRLHNGTEAVVTAVSEGGLALRTDDGREAELARSFVEGRRRDANPNLSHAWARTVDGCQGGTWAQVHLLGSAALDNFSAYVGQSRSRLATHTWNVTRVIEADYGGALADRRSPDEVVLAAMQRAPLKTFAFADDPWVLDRRLTCELAEHQDVLVTRPPERTRDLERAKEALASAEAELKSAHAQLAGAARRLDAIGPAYRLSRQGRQAHAGATANLEAATVRREISQQQVVDARAQVEVLEAAMAELGRWDAQHGWRLAEVVAIEGQLDRHWAQVSLGALGQGDPLAFGVDRLRAARATYAKDLQVLLEGLAPDRSRQLGGAERSLADAQCSLAEATHELSQAEASYVAAHQRRWGRRDTGLMSLATARVERAQERMATASDGVSACEHALAAERGATANREAALKATAPERARMEAVISEFDAALEATRAQRVVDMTLQPALPDHIATVLGPLPDTRGGQAVWCALAVQIEGDADRGTDHPHQPHEPGQSGHRWGDLWPKTQLDHRKQLVLSGAELDPTPASGPSAAESATWTQQLEQARAHRCELSRELERQELDIGIDL